MSFKCQVCWKYGEKPVRAVTKYAPITHPLRKNSKGELIDKGGEGWRIVSEVSAHEDCAGKVAAEKPAPRKLATE